MESSVIKGTSYVLIHTPDMLVHNGSTQTTERTVNPDSEYLKKLVHHLRSYEDAREYMPNQVYIGNMTPEELAKQEEPWYDKTAGGRGRFGELGEIMPQDEFIGLMQICDVFDLIKLEKSFAEGVKAKLEKHPLFLPSMTEKLSKNTAEVTEVEKLAADHNEPLYHKGEMVGVVKRAHDIDPNLNAHVIFENLVSKASGVLSLLHLIEKTGIDRGEVEYLIDCSEEACGDVNQRGGGNFAKAAAETAGFVNATGSDVRGFCAAPAHAVIQAAALVKAGVYKNVVVFAGGATAKLGMNGKDHVKKDIPLLEDVLGGFAVLIGQNDGQNPEINLNIVGRHTVGTGSSPQAVITSLVTQGLDRAGMKITDIDKFAAELQNPDVTKPAGAGDVPASNYKMIAALAVKCGEIERGDIAAFTQKHGMTGWAPTQGHIPSGVPFLGFARKDILEGKIKNAMIIGKGSLFLGRMTNLFDGVSFVIQANTKQQSQDEVVADGQECATAANVVKEPVIGLMTQGSELGEETVREGGAMVSRKGVKVVEVQDAAQMDRLIAEKKIDAAVAMHYAFPIGVSTVGRVKTPAKGREMFIATTTGTSAANRLEGMVKNAVYGIIVAKACGIKEPSVGIANVDGARQAEIALRQLADNGYAIKFAQSGRADGGAVMRGNDLLTAAADVMVTDPLTGNLLMKMFSAFETGGNYEATGYGYGPGVGKDYDKLVMIISRASGAPVVAGAIAYADELIRGGYFDVARAEFAAAEKAGLSVILEKIREREKPVDKSGIQAGQGETAAGKGNAGAALRDKPAKEVVTAEIAGIEIMEIEEAQAALMAEGIYAESGMGCTGPMILVSEANLAKARVILTAKGYIAE